MIMKYLLVLVLSCLVACAGTSATPKEKAGIAAAGACAVGDVVKYAGSVLIALGQPDYDTALGKVATTAGLEADAFNCIVKTVVAVFSAPSSAQPSTSQPVPAVVNGKAWLAAHGGAP